MRPNSTIAGARLIAPEFQITNESTVVGYVNYMQTAISKGIGDVLPDYSSLLPLTGNATAIIDELNIVLAAQQLRTSNIALMFNAINAMPKGTDTTRKNRIYAALVLVLASPEFIVLK